MASAAEQLAANLSWSSFSKATVRKQRIWFTLGALLIYRLSTYVPLPGINADQLATAFFHLGNLVEFDDTSQIFTNPKDERTESYFSGRIG